MEKASIPINTLIDRYLSSCRSAGMSPKTIRGYNEKLRRYVRMVGGTLGDFTLETVREHLTTLQKAKMKRAKSSTCPTTRKTPA